MNKNLLRTRFVVFDVLAAVIVWLLFMVFRRVVNDTQLFGDVSLFVPNYNYYSTFIIFPFLCVVVHYLSGFYVNPIKQSPLIDFFTTLVASVIISFVVFFVLLLDDIVIDYSYYYQALLVLCALLFVFTYTFRCVQSASIKRYFKKKKWAINTVIIGTGKNARKMADEISKNSYFNRVVGFVKVDSREKEVDKDQIIGRVDQLEKIVRDFDIQDAMIALDNPDEQRVFEIISKLFQYDIDIQFTPRLYEILTGRVRIDKYGLQPFISVSRPSMSDWQLCVKRTSDIILSFLSLALLFPLIIYFYIVIKIDSKGPVIFKQERIGRHGKPFNIYKFRTMHVNSESGVPKLSSPDDDRVTKVGRTMRMYRLDEIPQFVNVLKGDMSLVGPRPERKFYIDQIVQEAPYYCLLYRIRPGLTSWGPIKIGYSDTLEKMIERLNYDIVYMESMSLATDIKILISTIEIVFKGKGM